MAFHNLIGTGGEKLAANYLLQQRYSILHRDRRHSRYEIDIIATKNDTLRLIEIKSLSSAEKAISSACIDERDLEYGLCQR